MAGSRSSKTIGAADGIYWNWRSNLAAPRRSDRITIEPAPRTGAGGRIDASAEGAPGRMRRRAMSIGRQIAFWLAAFVVIGLLLRILGGAVAPFALGLVLGYLLDPIVQRLERLGLNR